MQVASEPRNLGEFIMFAYGVCIYVCMCDVLRVEKGHTFRDAHQLACVC